MRTALSGLYGITDSVLMPTLDQMLTQVELSILGGAHLIQYRDKSSDPVKRQNEASALNNLCQSYNVALIINDDIELALSTGAAGVHLGQSDGELKDARDRLGNDAIIGITCHDSLPLAEKAEQQGADYVAFGAFFPSKTKPNAKPAPLELMQLAKQKLTLPVVAIGGISVDNASKIIAAGADMVAVIHALYAQNDIKATAQQFHQQFNN
ncbi:thiamine phosphate synthase [Neptuniibacter sp. 2_MG-2023]|uniref:thiamine phosphate synthase n=1 Tax=Neptuniibacter sp. 2_MG-2023 TaxID=3062671 RepID=UPI0026E132BD|nr:thiamine phosphate synthase [Neptuniibacter sp. 2_MG-2023]MDO6515241.1 thiamine phosphate synthase [Neptuniibacter sp. 2_MG-2023]